MRQVIWTLWLALLFIGCGKEKEVQVPLVSHELKTQKIHLFNQSIPVKTEVLEKAYKTISPTIGLKNVREIKGKTFNGEFVFNEEHIPFIEYRFDKPYIIKKVDLLNSGFVVDRDNDSTNIKKLEIVFLDSQKTPIYTGELEEDAKYIKDIDNIEASGFIIKVRSLYAPEGTKENDIQARFDSRISLDVIDSKYIYDIITPVLLGRSEDTSNEELIRTISLLNAELFNQLKANKEDFKLPSKSLIYLPDDADMHYAVAHTKSIYKTGKYRTKNGEYKIFIFSENAEFDVKGTVEVKKHKIHLKDSNRNLKTTTQLPESEEFIDFSEGL